MSVERVPALVLHALGALPRLETVEVGDPGADEVRIHVAAAGLCHTDLGYMQSARAVPVVLGHEGAGVVESVGERVTHLQPGDRVAVNWQPKCGRCRHCLRGRRDLCESVLSTAAPRVHLNGAPLSVMLSAGVFSPLAVLPASGAVPIAPELPLEQAALLGCGVATGVGAALYTAQVQPGDDLLVIGCGGVGLNVIQGARLALARKIIAADINGERLELARRLGATHLLRSDVADLPAAVAEITAGRGVDHCFEVVGSPALMQMAIALLARGGMLTLVGAAERSAELSFAPRAFMSRQQRIVGCIYGNVFPERDLPAFAEWALDGRLNLADLHTHTVRLDDLPAIFAQGGPREGIRTVVRFEPPTGGLW
jgi:S-(hydroxymethyl)glutathione dehydrogenase/alcohol dehydrogenase